MMIGRIEGATRVLGKSQGYIGLPVRDEKMVDGTTGDIVPTMTTAWFPDPAELAAINAGEAIHLRLFGSSHPPVYIGVGNAEPHDQFAGFTIKVDPKTPDGTVELHDASGQVVAILQVKL
jgi:hypothetical protein